jgi:hypothetical protein
MPLVSSSAPGATEESGFLAAGFDGRGIREILKRWGGMSRQGEAFVTDGGQHLWRRETGDLTASLRFRPPHRLTRASLPLTFSPHTPLTDAMISHAGSVPKP